MTSTTITIRRTIFLSFFAAMSLHCLYAQDDKLAIKRMVDSVQFVFHARTAMPTSGGVKQLTSAYDVSVSKNKIVSNLPYFGRAYSVPYGSSDGGFNFTSKDFDYKSTVRKKGGWEISIKPKDVADLREFSLRISETGYGTLQALTNNRQPISFSGYISALNDTKTE